MAFSVIKTWPLNYFLGNLNRKKNDHHINNLTKWTWKGKTDGSDFKASYGILIKEKIC